MRADHDGKCDLCGAAEGDTGICGMRRKRALDEDHDHTTGAHRGFVCWRSNKWLAGWVTPEWLRAAALYLEAHS
jgi:Recombination endonuclease VII